MSDGLQVKVDFSELNRRIDEWTMEAGKEAPAALQTQARLFALQCARLTPPRRDNKSPVATNASQAETARQEAFKRIDRVLRKTFSIASQGFIENVARKHGTTDIDIYETQKNDVRMHIKWRQILFNQDQIKAAHRQAMQKKRIPKTWIFQPGSKQQSSLWSASAVVTRPDIDKYADHAKGNVGRMLASWAIPYMALGGQGKKDWRIPPWVRKHISGARGIVNTANLRGLCPEVTLGSHARGIGLVKSLVPFAIKVRMAAMKTDMSLYAKGIKRRFEK